MIKEVVKKDIINYLIKTSDILSKDGPNQSLLLKELSDRAIEDVAVQKDMDLISVTVFIYSLGKVIQGVSAEEVQDLVKEINYAIKHIKENRLGRYNNSIKLLFETIRKNNAKVQIHLQDVLQAARIKKGAILLGKGLSMGQAAGLMGLSNWDLQSYAGKTVAMQFGKESIPEEQRLSSAFKLFSV
ncbi:hypothetical protein COY27_05640 [Candidatus Woesearchaeota archaeon CG_4_10_14_0_2_um_filter_33_13]|nr:MAG: hypothetical protein COY27_05640 [Candidatus Woesearchaeota archaeon CG_4_10_14_0_2_um_filter_33_13]